MDQQIAAILDKMYQDFDSFFNHSSQCSHWGQETDRVDFFEAFARIYDIAPMHGDQVETFIRERYLVRNDPQYKEKVDTLHEICNAWSEWLYAWNKFPKM